MEKVAMPEFLVSGPNDSATALLLAHGAGAPMDSPFMGQMADLLAERGMRVVRFEFGYMAARRTGGTKRPPPKAETLVAEYLDAIVQAGKMTRRAKVRLIGGKSMGGRVASLAAGELFTDARIAGLVCLGYPFHPTGQPEKLRTEHLAASVCPTLIVQGERDPFGSKAEVAAMTLASTIQLCWLNDGDHDFGPRGASGFTRKGNLAAAADAVLAFATGLHPAVQGEVSP
jgi:uncharacterized protein